jgi:TPR repeat protein
MIRVSYYFPLLLGNELMIRYQFPESILYLRRMCQDLDIKSRQCRYGNGEIAQWTLGWWYVSFTSRY